MTSVTIGNGVTSIGDYAFYECKALTSVTIGNGVTSIPDYAFYNCKALTSVTIGNSVTMIRELAFWICSHYNSYCYTYSDECYSALTDFYCYATEPPTLKYASKNGYHLYPFKGIKNDATLYVPARCGAKYKSSKWSVYFKNIIEMD